MFVYLFPNLLSQSSSPNSHLNPLYPPVAHPPLPLPPPSPQLLAAVCVLAVMLTAKIAPVCALAVMLTAKVAGISYSSFHAFRYLIAASLFAAVCALAVMLTAKVAGISYSSFHAFRYLIAASVIAGFWALLLLLIDLGLLAAGMTSHSAIFKILRIIGDFHLLTLALPILRSDIKQRRPCLDIPPLHPSLSRPSCSPASSLASPLPLMP
ncbi:unnamed protein product [Closterium sp. Naga37s-1]|nr:unnamed protein product [Closterium sp. Naga37s-1]